MPTESLGAQKRALRILLIEDDPIDAAWLSQLIHEKRLGTEVVHSIAWERGLSILAKQHIDAVFFSVHPNSQTASLEGCRELVIKTNGRPVIALVDVSKLDHAADIYATGVRFIYGKHPIMRTAHIRKLEVRERSKAQITEQRFPHTRRQREPSGRG